MNELTPQDMKAARNRLGYSQKQVGEMLDPPASLRTVASWESGEFKPKSPRREQLAAILGLELHTVNAAPLGGTVGIPKHEIVQTLLRMRSEIDSLVSRL